MKKKLFYLFLLALPLALCLTSCSSDDNITPEITLADGAENYFTSSMDFSSAGGTKTLTFTSNTAWTLKVSDTQNKVNWCTLSQTEGAAGTFKVAVTVAENTGYDDRNVVLVLTAGELTKTVIVNQKQKNAITLTTDRFELGADGGTVDVEVKSNVEYSVEIPEEYQSWISRSDQTRSVSTNSLSFNIAESKEYDKREGEIIFTSGELKETVKIYQSGSAILVLSQNEYTIGNEGGSISIDISSNFEYEVDMPNVNWVKAAAKTRAVSSHTLTFDISENTGYDDREATIVFKDANSDKKESVTITQKQKDAILLSNDKIEVAQDGGKFSVDVNSNVEYTIEIPSSCSSWISRATASDVKGRRVISKTTPYFKVASSEELTKREGEIYFKHENIADTLKVYQSGGAVILLSQSEYNLEGGATSISIQLKSNIDYTVSSSVDWITEVVTRAVSSSTKSFDIAVNKTGSNRTGKITFTSTDGKKTAVVTVNQASLVNAKSLSISYNGTLNAYYGEKYDFYVTCNPTNANIDCSWSSSDNNVLSVKGNGKNASVNFVGLGTANILVKDNYSGLTAYRSVTVKFKDKSGTIDGHAYVDMGLPSGTMWASCNVGAYASGDYGDYFAWGETKGYKSGKTYFNWDSYSLCDGTEESLTKYNSKDHKSELETCDDAAYVSWGKNWRTPSDNQFQELYKYTTHVKTSQNGVYGTLFTSKISENSIFLPAAGAFQINSLREDGRYGLYWTRNLFTYQSAWTYGELIAGEDRCWGFSIRPVYQSK